MLRRAASTMIPDWTWVMSSFLATMLIRSAFVMAFLAEVESLIRVCSSAIGE